MKFFVKLRTVLVSLSLLSTVAHSQTLSQINGQKVQTPDYPQFNVKYYGAVPGNILSANPDGYIRPTGGSAHELALFGDSIGCGTGASVPYTLNSPGPFTDFAGQLHVAMGGRFVDDCRTGDQAADSSWERLWRTGGANADGTSPLYIYELGTNDVTHYNTSANQQKIYQRIVNGNLAFLSVPNANKVLAGSTTGTGTWQVLDVRPGGCYASTTNGNSYTLSFTTTIPNQAITYWYGIVDGSGGTFTLSLDSGASLADPYGSSTTFVSAGDGGATISTQNSLTTAVAGVRFVVPAAGSHTMKATVTSSTSTSNPVSVCGVGVAPASASQLNPPVIAVSINHRIGSSSSLDYLVPTYNGYGQAIVAQGIADGWNIVYADTYDALGTTTANFAGDGLHPSDTGHLLMYQAIRAAAPAMYFDGFSLINTSQAYDADPPHVPASLEEVPNFTNGISFFRSVGQTSAIFPSSGTAGLTLMGSTAGLCLGVYGQNQPIGYAVNYTDCWIYLENNGLLIIGGGTNGRDNGGNPIPGATVIELKPSLLLGTANYSLSNGDAIAQDFGSITTTAASSNTKTGIHVYSTGFCDAFPTNATAAAMTGVYAVWTSAYTVTIYHPSTAGGTFELFCSAGQTS